MSCFFFLCYNEPLTVIKKLIMKKKQILLDIITSGLFYTPIIEWDEDGYPHISGKEKDDKVFSDLKELANVMREIADDLDKA